MSYEDLMALDPRSRHQTFIRMTPRMKSDAMRVHIARWRDEHREALTPEQIALLGEWIQHASPEAYGPENHERSEREARELLARSFELFTREEIFEAARI